jgi:hypothetical protein
MTLPSSFPLSMSQVATECDTTLPLSLANPLVVALAGKSAPPVSMSDLLGKTISHFNGALTSSGVGQTFSIAFGNAPFFGGTLFQLAQAAGSCSLEFNSAPNWSGSIVVKNKTTGVNATLSKANSTVWSGFGSVIRSPAGYTDTYTVYGSP